MGFTAPAGDAIGLAGPVSSPRWLTPTPTGEVAAVVRREPPIVLGKIPFDEKPIVEAAEGNRGINSGHSTSHVWKTGRTLSFGSGWLGCAGGASFDSWANSPAASHPVISNPAIREVMRRVAILGGVD